MTGLSTFIVAHKLPTDPICPPVKQKLRKFKPDISLKIKEEATKQVKAKVLRVVKYPTWLANIVSVLKKDGKKAIKRQALVDHLAENPVDGEYEPRKTYFPDKEPAYCSHVEEEADGKPWFYDIKEYLTKGEYPELANPTQKRILRRFSNNFFHSGGILYRRTPDLGLVRCVDAKEASKLLEEIHVGTCDPHMNGFVLAKKILRTGYFWMTMETDCIQYV
ncbi:uncharacterized protein [Nicotiana sylvestris]|uniref:uncharacterized protein n=1 Tax=Nicotiana sylvestris TaxID=4096 RepID=UPI00388CA75E